MKKARFKKGISNLLAATMVATMVAPALPVYAAGRFTLDIESLFPGVFDATEKAIFELQGTPGAPIPSTRWTGLQTDGATPPRNLLPFIQKSGSTYKLYDYNGMLANKGISVGDYSLDGWYIGDQSAFSPRYYAPDYYPGGDEELRARGTGGANTNQYIVKTELNLPSGTKIYMGDLSPVYADVHPGSSFSKTANRIDGFKTSGATVNKYTVPDASKSSTRSGAAAFSSTLDSNPLPSALSWSATDNKVSGRTIPRDQQVIFSYVADTDKKQPIVIKDVVKGKDAHGNWVETATLPPRLAGPFFASETLPADAVAPDKNMITVPAGSPAGTVPRFILKHVGSDGVSGGLEEVKIRKSGTTDDKIPKLSELTASPDTSWLGLMTGDNLTANTTTQEISGNMVNYPVEVVYTYIVNPAYQKSVKIVYKDELGNNITDKVVAKLTANGTAVGTVHGATNSSGGGLYESNGELLYDLDRVQTASTDGKYLIPAPVLDGYLSTGARIPTMTIKNANPTSDGFANTSTSAWSTSTPNFQVTSSVAAPLHDLELEVTYNLDPSAVKKVRLAVKGGGKLVQASDGNDYVAGNTGRIESVAEDFSDHSYKISQAFISNLVNVVPDLGYTVGSWERKDASGNWVPFTPYAGTGAGIAQTDIPSSPGDTIDLRVSFDANPAMMNTYTFTSSDPNLNYSLLNTSPVTNIQNQTTVTMSRTDVDAASNASTVTANAGYRVGWFDSHGQEIDFNTGDITHMSGETFTARAVPTTPLNAYTPTGTGQLDDTTGAPTIQVDTGTQAIDPRLNYVVTDPSGNVVTVIPGSNLAGDNGAITGPFTPGYPYNIYTYDPATAGTPVVTGSPIPSTVTTSAPGQVVIPTTNPQGSTSGPRPIVAPDNSNPGTTSITVNPTTPNTDYQLLDPSGNVVAPWTTPTTPGAPVTFGGLDPNTTYTIVARTTGTNDPGYPANGTPVNTAVLTPVQSAHKVMFQSVMPPMNIKVGTHSGLSLSDLNSVDPGTRVEITANGIDSTTAPFNNFSRFTYPSSITDDAAANDVISFLMPNDDVTIVAHYTDPGVIISTVATPSSATATDTGVLYDGDQHTSGDAGVFPSITSNAPAGIYRLYVEKRTATAAEEAIGAAGERNIYTPSFVVTPVVQVYNPTTGNWDPYNGTVGDITLTLDTGSTNTTDGYTLKDMNGNVVSTGVDFNSTNSVYPGYFTLSNFVNGQSYIFGSTRTRRHNVIFKSNKDSSYSRSFVVMDGDVLSANSSRQATYTGDIASIRANGVDAGGVDINGVTWTYRGLSTSATSYVPFNDNDAVLSDTTVYIYFDSDAPLRASTATALGNAITRAQGMVNARNLTIADEARLQDAINRANAILAQTSPRKASTPELQAILDEINRYLGVRPIISGGGGGSRGSSGGSGGGSGSSSGVINTQANVQAAGAYRVGVDGDWELVDAANHKWVFNLKNGTRVTGWQKLAYTYGNTTRTEWYHFAGDNIMDHGWFLDQNTNRWYYLSDVHDGFFGHMVEGWHQDDQDGRWYYQNLNSGEMLLNWQHIGDAWYYLNPYNNGPTWFYNNATQTWDYSNNSDRPYGSLYVNETTKDGYKVDENGRWVK